MLCLYLLPLQDIRKHGDKTTWQWYISVTTPDILLDLMNSNETTNTVVKAKLRDKLYLKK